MSDASETFLLTRCSQYNVQKAVPKFQHTSTSNPSGNSNPLNIHDLFILAHYTALQIGTVTTTDHMVFHIAVSEIHGICHCLGHTFLIFYSD